MSIWVDLLGGVHEQVRRRWARDVPRRSRQLICVECSNEPGDAQAAEMAHFRP